ncbi:electron transfer flavoprotein subunit alpha, partial [Candidatus Parcubacteria bacterium]
MAKEKAQVWVFVEQRSGVPADVSFELLSKGYKLAAELKGTLKAVVIGHQVQEIAQRTFHFGAEEALVVDHPALKEYNTLPYSRI